MTEPLPRVQTLAGGPGRAPVLQTLAADALGDQDRVEEIFAGRLSGVLVTEAFEPGRMAALVAWLDAHPGDWGPLQAAPFPGLTYGAVLLTCAPDLVAYTEKAAALKRGLSLAGFDPGEVFLGLLGRLRGGAPVAPPRSAAGQDYAPVTIKRLAPGQGVAIHSEQAEWPAMSAMKAELASPIHQLSTYAPMATGQGGGELLLYHLPPEGQRPSLEGLSAERAHQVLAAFGLTVVRPRVGDLLLFDGGRFNHQVTACKSGERWTIGGFLARGADRVLRLWS